jgi:hypothetical protein
MSDPTEIMAFPIRVPLKKPLTVNDVQTVEISFREPDGSDCLAFGRTTTDAERVRVFFERLSNCPYEIFMKLRWDDYARCEEIANRFFGVYQSVSGFSLTALLSSPSFLEAVSKKLNEDPSPKSAT